MLRLFVLLTAILCCNIQNVLSGKKNVQIMEESKTENLFDTEQSGNGEVPAEMIEPDHIIENDYLPGNDDVIIGVTDNYPIIADDYPIGATHYDPLPRATEPYHDDYDYSGQNGAEGSGTEK